MAKTVALVGHCGADSTYLRMAVMQVDKSVRVVSADEEEALNGLLEQGGADLVLFNRELPYGFDESLGVDVIRRLRPKHPGVKMMLVSNYPDAQAAAMSAGALQGFGKRDIGSPRATQLLRAALD